MGTARHVGWGLGTAVWTWLLAGLCSLDSIATIGVDSLPLLPVSWSLVLATVGPLVAFAIAIMTRRRFGASGYIWIGSTFGSLAVFAPQIRDSVQYVAYLNDLLFLHSATGGTPSPVTIALGLAGYPLAVWAACRFTRDAARVAAQRA